MASLTIPEVQANQTILNALSSKRARLMKALLLLLPTITTSRGYTTNVETVSFNVKAWRDLPADQTPSIYIIDDQTKLIKHAGCIREYTWTVRLFGCVKDKDIMMFEEFIADIEECIYDNNTLFGQVNKVEVEEVTTDNQLFSEINDNGAHLFEMVLGVEYTRKARDPR